jgi:branched-chain amino acid transport system permease protein
VSELATPLRADAHAGAGPARQARRERWQRHVAFALLVVVLLLLPGGLNNYTQFVVNTMLVYVLVAVGFNVIMGYLGQLAFSSASFFGVGAYGAGLAMARLGLPFPAAIVVGALAGGVVGALVGLPALRVRGHYLAIITLAVGELLRWCYVHLDALTYGAGGFTLPPMTALGGPLSDRGKYYVFLVCVAIGVGTTSLLLRSRFGRAFAAVRNNEQAAASLGIDLRRTKVLAFAWSGLIVGLGGALFAVLNGRVSPESFGLAQVLFHFAIIMIGGLGSLVGSVVGAVLLTGAPELLRNFPGSEEIVFSLLLIAVLFFLPRGIGGLIADHVPFLRERLYREDGRA